MSKKWYMTGRYKSITPVMVEKFTDNMVWINGSRRMRISSDERYYPTRNEAFDWRRGFLAARLESCEDKVANIKQRLIDLDKYEAAND